MAQTPIVPGRGSVTFLDRLTAALHAAHNANDTDELTFLMNLHAMSCVNSLRDGLLLVADDFAGLAALADDMLRHPVARELRRPVTEPPAPEEDLQLGENQ